jgi:ribonucrease Y
MNGEVMTFVLIILLLLLMAAIGSALFFYQQLNAYLKKFDVDLKNSIEREKNDLIKEADKKVKEELEHLRLLDKQKIDEYRQELKNDFEVKKQEITESLNTRNELILEKKKLELRSDFEEKYNLDKKELENARKSLELKLNELTEEKAVLSNTLSELKVRAESLQKKDEEIAQKEQQAQERIRDEMEKIASLTVQKAREKVIEQAQKEMGEELLQWQNKYLDNFEQKSMDIAREITVLAIQRCSSEVANEFTITTVKIENDDDKGKLIGKQGRNIQWLEKTLGIELIIDDTPGVITVSGFSSVRRHIAKKTIEKLLQDGRVHPSSIEETYEKVKGEIAQEIMEAGQSAMNELGIYDFPPQLIRLIGRLKFRTGYGQNVLKHSIEMAKLSGLLADGINAEFKMRKPIDRMVCVKGALLHDIGKAVDEEMNPKGNHIEIGEKICDMFDLDWKIKKCISSHHTTGGDRQSYWDEARNQICLEAAVVDACDTLSGGRPGARKETMEAYFQRMEALENVANKVPGVSKSWIMRGGTEIWVFFDAESMSPVQVHRATRKLAREINNVVRTPKEIKVIGIREDKVVEWTR